MKCQFGCHVGVGLGVMLVWCQSGITGCYVCVLQFD